MQNNAYAHLVEWHYYAYTMTKPASMPATVTAITPGHAPRRGDGSDTAFLAALGRQVRALRTEAGLTRRELARSARVSERYLVQLEAGSGNSSVLMLRQVAAVLGVGLAHLFGDGESAPEARRLQRLLDALPRGRRAEVIARMVQEQERAAVTRRRRIALVGLRGAGKSTLGNALAAALKQPFIELDQEIERAAGMTLAEIFSLYGQGGFRRLERRCLERVLRRPGRAVLAVGGGIVAAPDTYDLLLQSCCTVWLRAAPEAHMQRVIDQGDTRPMAGKDAAMEDLRQILRERDPLYRRADFELDTTHQPVAASLRALRRALEL